MTFSISRLEIIDYLGPTPCDEECAQIGEDDFTRLSQLECRTFVDMLNRLFPVPDHLKNHVGFSIKTETGHDAGYYREVVIRGNCNIPEVDVFANKVATTVPTTWDNRAKVKLAIGWGYMSYYTDAPTERDLEQTVTDILVSADPHLAPIFPDEIDQQANIGQHPLYSSQGDPYRRVWINPQEVKQQLQRYQEGGHQALPDNEWENFYETLISIEGGAPVG